MGEDALSIGYPRRTLQRSVLHMLGRALLPLLLRIRVTGRQHFPAHGPLLIVGNHIGAMEVPLMIAYAPWQVEMLGPGDIPPPPALQTIARLYGYTPINRGNPDRLPLLRMLDVLKQGGVVGLFPEGGVWDPGAKPAKRGVAWLSHRAQAPILPVGFGGLGGALKAATRLQRPQVSIAIGEVIAPVTTPSHGSRKEALEQAAACIMQAVHRLVPQEPRAGTPQVYQERFDLLVRLGGGTPLAQATETRHLAHGPALCRMLYRPAILRVFARDLKIDVAALQHLAENQDAAQLAAATSRVLRYVRDTNPGFFTYRFAYREGKAIEAGLSELHELAARAAASGQPLSLTPVRRYRLQESGDEVVETSPGEPHEW